MDSLDAFSGSFSERMVKNALSSRIPISGTFELLPQCNMRCRMCYIQHNPSMDELQPVAFWEDIFDQAITEGLIFPLLTGGEPFLYPGFEALYEQLMKKPIHMCLNTNATLLDRERVKWLSGFPTRRLNISLYGASDETYAKLCGNPNGFSQVMRAFDLLKEYHIPFRVHSVMVPENIGDYRRMIEICNRLQVPLSMANYMFPSYRKDGCGANDGARLSPVELAKRSLIYLRDHFIGKDGEYLHYLSQRCAAMEHPEMYSLYGKNDVACKGGVCTYWVDWRGNMSGCGVHNQGSVSLHDMTFKEAWKKVVAYTNEIRISEKCRHCRYRCICIVCPAAAFCETGCMNEAPEYLCQYAETYGKLLIEERSRLLGKA